MNKELEMPTKQPEKEIEKSEKHIEKSEKKKLDKVIEIFSVSKVYDGITVVDDMNLSIKRGEFVTLLGPSGCGKTTLLRMIAGFTNPTSGKIFLDGVDVTDIPPHKRPINTVFQKYALFPHLNVFKNVAFGLKLKRINIYADALNQENASKQIQKSKKMSKAEIKQKVEKVLKMVGLDDYGHRDVASLSGGQQQRVAIARALVLEPRVLLLDEPLGALDLKMRKDMQAELKKMHKESGITFVYVTHDQEEALTMSDNVAVIKDGVIQQYNTPQKIYDEPANAFVADFIGESNILSGIMRSDYNVEFLSVVLKCLDKGFEKNEKVDLVIRPEDIRVLNINDESGNLKGKVINSVFKGTFYQMGILVSDYEFTVQSTVPVKVGTFVALKVEPNGIHIMKRTKSTNSFITQITGENTVDICGGSFEFLQPPFMQGPSLEKGDNVKVNIAFDKVELMDDEEDGVIGGNIAQSLYKGSYYQVQVDTDDDQDFIVDTPDDWDIGDRVGIKIKPEDILVERYIQQEEESSTHFGLTEQAK